VLLLYSLGGRVICLVMMYSFKGYKLSLSFFATSLSISLKSDSVFSMLSVFKIISRTLLPTYLERGHQSLLTKSSPLISVCSPLLASNGLLYITAAYFFFFKSKRDLKTPSSSISRVLYFLLISYLI